MDHRPRGGHRLFSGRAAMLISRRRVVDGHPARLTHPPRRSRQPSYPSPSLPPSLLPPPVRARSSNVLRPHQPALGSYSSLLRQRLSPPRSLLLVCPSPAAGFPSLSIAYVTLTPFPTSFSLPSFPPFLDGRSARTHTLPTNAAAPTRSFFTLASSFFPRGVHVEV